jgi:hypothetical protein
MVKNKKCKLFALDLMHLATNEIAEIKRLKTLQEHIKECPACCDKLDKLRAVDVFAFLTAPRSAKYKAGMKKLIERAKSESGSNGNHTKCGKDKGKK